MSKRFKPTGYAFNTSDLFMNFSLSRLQFSCKECLKYFKTFNRMYVVKKIFCKFISIALTDIIENNITLHLPGMGVHKGRIVMRRVIGKELQRRRKNGEFKEIDITKSGMCAYEMVLYTHIRYYRFMKKIHFGEKSELRIIEKTNQGFAYGDGKCDKTASDYIKVMHDKYPFVSENDIKKILTFGLKSLYLHNDYGGDVAIRSGGFRCFFGEFIPNPVKGYSYYAEKLSVKFRVIYRRKRTEWDGYYYFALNNNKYEQYLLLKEANKDCGRIHLGQVTLYRLYDECKIKECRRKYIFRVSGVDSELLKFKKIIKCFISDSIELMEIRELPKLKDILISHNNYLFL